MSVIGYFNILVELWHEMDLFHTINWECTGNSKRYYKMIEKDRIFDFLHGLNIDLDELRGKILGTKPLSSLREVFVNVRREESRRKVMLYQLSDLSINQQNSTFANVKPRENFSKGEGREKQWCDHCKRPYHRKDTCW